MNTATSSNNLRGSLLVATSALMFGSYGLFARFLAQYDIFYQTFVRCFLITALFILFGLYTKQFKKIDKKDWKWFSVVLVFTNFTIAPIFYAFRHLEIGTASFLFYAAFTVFSYLFGVFFFNEKMTVLKITSLVLAILGMILIFTVSFSLVLFVPMVLAIFNGLASGGEVTFSKKISGKYSNVQINTLVWGSIGITHMFLSFLIGEQMDLTLLTTSLPVLLMFMAAAIIGMVTVIAGFKLVEPSIGAIVGLLEIVFSVLFGFLFFQEALSLKILLGGGMILVAALLPSAYELATKKNYTKKIAAPP